MPQEIDGREISRQGPWRDGREACGRSGPRAVRRCGPSDQTVGTPVRLAPPCPIRACALVCALPRPAAHREEPPRASGLSRLRLRAQPIPRRDQGGGGRRGTRASGSVRLRRNPAARHARAAAPPRGPASRVRVTRTTREDSPPVRVACPSRRAASRPCGIRAADRSRPPRVAPASRPAAELPSCDTSASPAPLCFLSLVTWPGLLKGSASQAAALPRPNQRSPALSCHPKRAPSGRKGGLAAVVVGSENSLARNRSCFPLEQWLRKPLHNLTQRLTVPL